MQIERCADLKRRCIRNVIDVIVMNPQYYEQCKPNLSLLPNPKSEIEVIEIREAASQLKSIESRDDTLNDN